MQLLSIPPEFVRARALGLLVAHLRRRRGLTQRALAAAAGVAQPTVSRIEAGGLVPASFDAHDLARALGTTSDGLLAGMGDALARAERLVAVLFPDRAGTVAQWWVIDERDGGEDALRELLSLGALAAAREMPA